MENNNEILLKVDHLCQYFRMGRRDLKAVDNVSFDIKRGEAFGLVGESGCGKTTTGRTIIKLYEATSGDVYFKGHRICAGIRSYKDAIKEARAKAKAELSQLAQDTKANPDNKAVNDEKIAEIKAKLAEVVAENKAKIASAKADQKHIDKRYSDSLVQAIDEKYLPLINEATDACDAERLASLTKEYKEEKYKAKHTKLITQIQMIFQDPVASLDPRMTVRDIISEGLIIQGEKDEEKINQKVYEMLELVGLV